MTHLTSNLAAHSTSVSCLGQHLLIDVWDAQGLDQIQTLEAVLREAVTAAGATLLHIHLHQFGNHGGVSGVAVLAESHISVHSWPEHGYAAFDVFMCGSTKPEAAVAVIESMLQPGRVRVHTVARGATL